MKIIFAFGICLIFLQQTLQNNDKKKQHDQQIILENTQQQKNDQNNAQNSPNDKKPKNFSHNQQIHMNKQEKQVEEQPDNKQEIEEDVENKDKTPEEQQLVLKDTVQNLVEKEEKTNYDFCNQNIITNFLYRQFNFVQPKKLESKSPFCPKITHSCCTLREIEELSNIFKNNANSAKKLFDKIKMAFHEYVNDRQIVFDYLKQISPKDEECAGHTKDELISLFKLHINNYQLRTRAIDRFQYFTLRMQSGFVCSMCDISQQRKMVLKDRLQIEIHQLNCSRVFNEKLRFSSVIYSLYNLAKVVRGVQCHIQKSSQKFQGSSMDLFFQEIAKIKRCLTDFSVQTALRGSICQSLCQNIFNYNKIQNIDNIFNYANQLLDFKAYVLDKKKGIFNPQINHSSEVQVLLVPPRKKKISFRMNDVDYLVVRNGIDLYNNHLHISATYKMQIFILSFIFLIF